VFAITEITANEANRLKNPKNSVAFLASSKKELKNIIILDRAIQYSEYEKKTSKNVRYDSSNFYY